MQAQILEVFEDMERKRKAVDPDRGARRDDPEDGGRRLTLRAEHLLR